MSKDFLLEIATEPLPARFVAPALSQLLEKTRAALKENRLEFSGAQSLGTMRRLAVCVCGLADRSEPLLREVQGPPARLLKDADGRFTAQAEGFARKQGVRPEELETVSTPKGEFLLARLRVPGEAASKILARVIPEIIAGLEFPKTLEWEASRFRFGRPIRGLTALFGKSVIPVRLAGVRSGRTVRGLGRAGAALASAERYSQRLRDLLVLADPEERRGELRKRLEAAAKLALGSLDFEGGLLEETVFMTEHPVAVVGRFHDDYLKLPAPLLKMVLKKQLKFFPLLGPKGPLSAFVGVRDGISEGQAQVREGYERVLTARLSDAAFFVGRDEKTSLKSKLPALARVTYHNKLGSMADKSYRVEALTGWICAQLRRADLPLNEDAARQIASLAYADLVCETVKEFPELQGLMGGFYARHDGLDERVALGLEEFYQPATAGSPLPTTLEGAAASLAGKLDSLAGHFSIGNAPTGSADPFALRRQAVGALRIVLEKQLPLDFEAALGEALTLLRGDAAARAKTWAALLDFLWGRAQAMFEEQGYRADEIRSVASGGLRCLPDTFRRLAAIHALRGEPDFEALAAVFKRAANILRQAAQKGEPIPDDGPSRGALAEPAELALLDAVDRASAEVVERLANGHFEDALRAVVALKPGLDAFFDGVMVMAEDKALRAQRLALLARLVRLIKSLADLSEIQGPER
jgi:glycyl-tRNA synthetase beta chain